MCVCAFGACAYLCVYVCVCCPRRWPFPTWAPRCRRCSGTLSESPFPSHPIRVNLFRIPSPSYPIRINLSESPCPSHAVHPVRAIRFQVTRGRRGRRVALSESSYPSHPIRVILSESSYPSLAGRGRALHCVASFSGWLDGAAARECLELAVAALGPENPLPVRPSPL